MLSSPIGVTYPARKLYGASLVWPTRIRFLNFRVQGLVAFNVQPSSPTPRHFFFRDQVVAHFVESSLGAYVGVPQIVGESPYQCAADGWRVRVKLERGSTANIRG